MLPINLSVPQAFVLVTLAFSGCTLGRPTGGTSGGVPLGLARPSSSTTSAEESGAAQTLNNMMNRIGVLVAWDGKDSRKGNTVTWNLKAHSSLSPGKPATISGHGPSQAVAKDDAADRVLKRLQGSVHKPSGDDESGGSSSTLPNKKPHPSGTGPLFQLNFIMQRIGIDVKWDEKSSTQGSILTWTMTPRFVPNKGEESQLASGQGSTKAEAKDNGAYQIIKRLQDFVTSSDAPVETRPPATPGAANPLQAIASNNRLKLEWDAAKSQVGSTVTWTATPRFVAQPGMPNVDLPTASGQGGTLQLAKSKAAENTLAILPDSVKLVSKSGTVTATTPSKSTNYVVRLNNKVPRFKWKVDFAQPVQGPLDDGNPSWSVNVKVNTGTTSGEWTGSGKSKGDAKTAAAKAALEELEDSEEKN